MVTDVPSPSLCVTLCINIMNVCCVTLYHSYYFVSSMLMLLLTHVCCHTPDSVPVVSSHSASLFVPVSTLRFPYMVIASCLLFASVPVVVFIPCVCNAATLKHCYLPLSFLLLNEKDFIYRCNCGSMSIR